MSALRFAALFDGRKDAYGLGRGLIVRRPLTLHDYSRHLAGEDSGIGIFPLLDDATVRFAAIDLDRPDFEAAADLADLIPGQAWIERSRSGNAHIWVFFDGPCPAWVARGQLRLALDALGMERVEVFPKQAELLPGMIGNYINLPYHGDDRPILRLPQHDGDTGFIVPLDSFIEAAEANRIDPEAWLWRCREAGIEPPSATSEGEWGERAAPHSCALYMLQHKEDNPLRPGARQVVLFNLAKMLLNCRDYDVGDAISIVRGYNDAGERPLPDSEIATLVANAARGQYTSTGCDDPLMAPYVDPECPIASG